MYKKNLLFFNKTYYFLMTFHRKSMGPLIITKYQTAYK